MGNIHPDDLLKRAILQQRPEKLALSAPQIENASGAGRFQCRDDRADALLPELERFFDRHLFGGTRLLLAIRIGQVLLREARQGLSREVALMAQVTPDDGVTRRVRSQPALALAQEFLDFIVADPVVLLRVQDGNQHVEVSEEIRKAHISAQLNRVVRTLAPFREPLVQGMMLCRHLVAQRLEQLPQEWFAASARHDRYVRGEVEPLLGQFGLTLASPGESASQYLRDRHAQVGGGDVGPIVDVLIERAALARGTSPH